MRYNGLSMYTLGVYIEESTHWDIVPSVGVLEPVSRNAGHLKTNSSKR